MHIKCFKNIKREIRLIVFRAVFVRVGFRTNRHRRLRVHMKRTQIFRTRETVRTRTAK